MLLSQPKIEIGWRPIPDSSQELALNSPCHHTLYTGARGPGKTDTQLMFFRKNVGMGWGKFWRGIIFDREYKMLDDLVSKSKRWFYEFGDGSVWLTAKSDYKWVWPTGEELLIRSIDKEDDYWNYHGQEFPFIGWNELCKYPNDKLYNMMMSCNRSSFTPEKDTPQTGRLTRPDGSIIYDRAAGLLMPRIPLRVFATTNPYGPGHNWVKRRFITPAPYGVPIKREFEIFNPATKQDEIVVKTQVTIFGTWRENIYLAPEYIAELTSMEDENMRKAWEEGDWNIVAGGAIDDLWKPNIHVVPRFNVPADTYIDRSFDWGSTTPFHIGWWMETNGEEYDLPGGRKWCPEPGSLVLCHEWYGAKEIGTNKGLKLSATDIATHIIEIETELMQKGWFGKQPEPGPADNQIRNVNDTGTDTIEKFMADEGVLWEASDKSRGSRKVGLQLFRDRLSAAIKGEGPAIYFMDHCRAAIDILPSLPRDPDDPDDVDSETEDHPWDSTRFRVLKGVNRFVTELDFRFAT